jgi:hypothetical protein
VDLCSLNSNERRSEENQKEKGLRSLRSYYQSPAKPLASLQKEPGKEIDISPAQSCQYFFYLYVHAENIFLLLSIGSHRGPHHPPLKKKFTNRFPLPPTIFDRLRIYDLASYIMVQGKHVLLKQCLLLKINPINKKKLTCLL